MVGGYTQPAFLTQDSLQARLTPSEKPKAISGQENLTDVPGPWASVDAIYERLRATGRTFSDSANLLREDRDRRANRCLS